MKFFFCLFLYLPLVAQTDLFLPWTPNNDIFNTRIIINNNNSETVFITLTAARNLAQIEVEELELAPFSSIQADAGDLFEDLGSGAGYVVNINSEAANITASSVVFAQTTTSGESPSQMNAIPGNQASERISFNYLPVTPDGFSAPVVVSLAETPSLVRFHAYKDGLEVGEFLRNIVPGEVFALQTSEMFPGVQGGLYVIAEGDVPLVGTAFIFNGSREPAMTPAVPVAIVPDPMGTIERIRIVTTNSTIDQNQTQNFMAQALFLQGPFQEITDEVTWTSLDPSIATVSNSGTTKGLVTAIKEGETMIQIEKDGFTDMKTVKVLGPRLKIELGQCFGSINDCNWFETFFPNVQSYERTISGSSIYAIDSYRFTAVNRSYEVESVTTIDRNGIVEPFVTAVGRGIVIEDGQQLAFTLACPTTNGQQADLLFEIKFVGVESAFRHEVLFTAD